MSLSLASAAGIGTGLAAGIGMAQGLVAACLVAHFSHRRPAAPADRPPVTVLKPLYGDEPLLERALASICEQDYPEWQVVFGVQNPSDPAIAVIERLRARYAAANISLVIDPTIHGSNLKVGNLINMFPHARHDVLVIADSDVHVRHDYLERLVAALQQPGVGLVTTLYAGLPAWPRLPAWLAATQISHLFLPSAVLARALGRQDCLGATMCLRRQDLARIGGLQALADHLADDNVLGRRIAALGLRVALADTLVLTTAPEARLAALFHHELRWARTIRALEPAGFAASVLQYPLAWALLTLLLSGGAAWAAALFLSCWLTRGLGAVIVNRSLRRMWGSQTKPNLAFRVPLWLLPIRDVLSVAVMLASYGGRRVDWRGHAMDADSPARSAAPHRPLEEVTSR